jgi:uncharacterized protein (DUF1501 family)
MFHVKLSRRRALLGLSSAWTFGRVSLALAVAPTQQRFIVILLRGALDGLAAVPPYGDPNLTQLRAELVPPAPGTPDGMLDLGGFYGLHPSLVGCHQLYSDGTLAIVHAVAGPTRSRSHFDAQDCLESGANHRLDSGWLNRAVAAIPGPRPDSGLAMSVGVTAPLILRGGAKVAAWAPAAYADPGDALYAKIAELNQGDPVTGPAFAEALRERGFIARVADSNPSQGNPSQGHPSQGRFAFPAVAKVAGQMLAAPDGPRIAALEAEGWDTHVAQVGRLSSALKPLDQGLLALRDGLGPAWSHSAILVVTEFGRTVRVNGTHGTDHGTATVAFLAGGAVAGGRVVATWPGLASGQLLEDRDLAPTQDVRVVAMALLTQHLGVPQSALPKIFPGSTGLSPATGLLRA